MPTIKQETAFKLMLENVREHNPKAFGTILREAGYGKIAGQPTRIVRSDGWKELMAKHFPDKRIQKLIDKALKEYEEEGEIKDKRAFLGLMDMLIKLKDLYPKDKTKIVGLFERIESIRE